MKCSKAKSMAIVTALVLTGASLQAACTVTATDLGFATYDTTNSTPTDGTGNVNVHCTFLLAIALSYTVKFDTGGSGTYAPREMQRDATYSLEYNLYTDSSRTTVWGDGTGGTGYNSFFSLLGLLTHNRDYTVYGRIPAQQDVPGGRYSDTITVTLEY